MRTIALTSILLLALGLVTAAAPAPVRAATAPLGLHTYAIYCPNGNQMGPDELLQLIKDADIKSVKVLLPASACSDTQIVRRLITEAGVSQVILRGREGLDGYDYQAVRHDLEMPRGIDGSSFGQLVQQYPQVDWWLEIGNEPNYNISDPWAARWWGLAVYKELALNTQGHIDQAWRAKYPNLRWAFSMPVGPWAGYTTTQAAEIVLRWMPEQGLGGGGILDYYDAVALHLYGPTYPRHPNMTHVQVEQFVLGNPYHDLILYTEVGVWEGDQLAKTAAYRQFRQDAPPETVGISVFLAARGTAWPQFELWDPAALSQLGGG